ncbi:UNVERIFIED_CONTAM: hypothetical protein GTU68_010415, partial [Idotea baltica]|nr:hypothetical protein [Idotea baltica]
MSEPAPPAAGISIFGCRLRNKSKAAKKDVSLIVSESDVVGGVFTRTNRTPTFLLCQASYASGTIRAVVDPSAMEIACTGQSGMDDAVTMCQQVAAKVGCDESQVLVMSTGVIGQPLPMDKIAVGIEQAHDQLGNDHESFLSAADAILTTDNARKMVQRTVVCGGKSYEIAAMAKGAGMISPNMATMLAVVLTDAPLESTQCQTMLAKAADLSFNRVSVDGHTSTNDTLLLLSSG